MISHLPVIKLTKTWKILVIMFSMLVSSQVAYAASYEPEKIVLQQTLTEQLPKQAVFEITKTEQLLTVYRQDLPFTVIDTGNRIVYDSKELFCLAKNIYHEAGSEPVTGRFAVAQVTINRTVSPSYHGSICHVVSAPKQFAWANNRHLRYSIPRGNLWEEAKEIAQETLEGKRVVGLEDALYFHEKHIHPRWRRVAMITQIGSHIFYK